MIDGSVGMRNEKSRELNPCFANDIIIVGTTMSGAAKLRWNANARDATHQRARNSDKWRKQSGIQDCRWSKVATNSAIQLFSPITFVNDCVDLHNNLCLTSPFHGTARYWMKS